MKRTILPTKYTYDFFRRSIIGLILIGIVLVDILLENYMKSTNDASSNFIFRLTLSIVGLIIIIVSLHNNINVHKNRIWRRHMLTQVSVDGYIIDIKMIKRKSFDRHADEGEQLTKVSIYYSLVVKYNDYISGNTKIIETNKYNEMLPYLLANNNCKVYIDYDTSEVLADEFNIRTSNKDSYVKIKDKYEDKSIKCIGGIFATYGNLIGILLMIGVILITAIIVTY